MSSNILDTSVLSFNIEKIRRSVFPEPVALDFSLKDDDLLLCHQNHEFTIDSKQCNQPVISERQPFILDSESII